MSASIYTNEYFNQLTIHVYAHTFCIYVSLSVTCIKLYLIAWNIAKYSESSFDKFKGGTSLLPNLHECFFCICKTFRQNP